VTPAPHHERFAELASGHALHALEPADEELFRSHLAGCAECRAAVATHTDTLGHLAYAAASPQLPSGILAGIRAEIGQAAPVASGGSARPVASLEAARTRRRLRTVDSKSLVAAAAAAAMVLSLGIWNVALHREKSQGDLRSEQLAAAVATLEGGAKHRVQLTDSRGVPVAIAVVRSNDTVSLVVDGLAPNTASSTYVLWQKGQYGVMRAVGTFDVHGRGVDVVKDLPLARDVMGVEGFAVTREPGRRAPARPGSSTVADGGLSA